MTLSLQRLRARSVRAPWFARLVAAWVALSFTFALTPCCDIVGKANATPADATVKHDHASGAHASDAGGSSCAAWLDHSDAVPPKAGDVKPFLAMYIVAAPTAFRIGVVAPERAEPFPRFPVSPPIPLYLRHARLIL